MKVFRRSLAPHANAKWQYEEFSDRKFTDAPLETGFMQAIKRIRLFPQEFKSWAIIRVSDMTILAQSKDYRP